MQIKAIILYNEAGDIRELKFRLGQVNIIAGRSSTGKSALIDILDYCLGKSTFNIPEGVIKNSVEWYGLLLQVNDSEIFIAKPKPQELNEEQSSVFLDIGSSLSIPSIEELVPNTNDSALVKYLSTIAGISPNIHIPDEGQTREPLEANFKHTKYYLFQKQNLIANQDALFYNQTDQWQAQAIRDTIPYMLGAIQEDYLQLVNDFRDARRLHRSLLKSLQEAEDIVVDVSIRAEQLLIEAKQVGLVSDEALPENADEILEILKRAQNWVPQDNSSETDDQLIKLQDEYEQLHNHFHTLNEQVSATRAFQRNASGYQTELSEQANRLESINLIPSGQDDDYICPLCGNEMNPKTLQAAAIRESLQKLKNDLDSVEAEKPRVTEYLSQLTQEKETIRERLRTVERSIDTVLEQRELAQRIRDKNTRIARVAGRISLFIESINESTKESELKKQVEEAKARVDYLAAQISPDDIEERYSSILNLIASRMTDMAKILDLEHKDYAYRFNEKSLTVYADRPGNPIPMQRMGGGENWLGCHLITLLSLHRYFVEENRPVPNFIVFDQPTQVYFPPDIYGLDEVVDGNALNDEDLFAVNRMFNLMFDFCETLNSGFQIIVTEHANLHNERFRDAMVEDFWSDGRALIPESWLKH